jgi:hypothetical protein
MAFTDHCGIFAAFHEDGFNRIINHVRAQRPSLFNYATAFVAAHPELLCAPLKPHPIVHDRGNPLVTIEDPLPIPGTPYGVNFAVQLTDLRIDFHKGSLFALPPELDPLLKQRLAIKLRLCAGIGCPPKEIVDKLVPPPPPPRKRGDDGGQGKEKQPIIPLPTRELICFCLDAFVVGGIRVANYNGKPYLEPFLDGFEIVDIQPQGLEDGIECYISLLLRLSVLPGLRVLLAVAPLNLTQGVPDLFLPTNVALSPTPISAAVPNNPAIEDDLLKVFVNAEVI